MITRRLTAQIKVVSQFDDAYIKSFTAEQREEYSATLDIKKLGNLTEAKYKPTVFTIDPLKTKYEYLTYQDTVDAWSIFATHVKSLEYCDDIQLTFRDGIIEDEFREIFPIRIVQNIASMIIALANQAGSEVFFMQSVGVLRYSQQVLLRDAQSRMEGFAPLAVAKIKNSK